jgi:hypothetical protein
MRAPRRRLPCLIGGCEGPDPADDEGRFGPGPGRGGGRRLRRRRRPCRQWERGSRARCTGAPDDSRRRSAAQEPRRLSIFPAPATCSGRHSADLRDVPAVTVSALEWARPTKTETMTAGAERLAAIQRRDQCRRSVGSRGDLGRREQVQLRHPRRDERARSPQPPLAVDRHAAPRRLPARRPRAARHSRRHLRWW